MGWGNPDSKNLTGLTEVLTRILVTLDSMNSNLALLVKELKPEVVAALRFKLETPTDQEKK